MKKLISILLAVCICAVLTSCTNNNNTEPESSTAPTTEQTTKLPEENTTKAPEQNSQRGEELQTVLKNSLGNGELDGDFDIGKFTFKNTRDAQVVFAYEHTEEMESKAQSNADKLVNDIKSLYGDKIKLYSFVPEQIGNGENGIDSVRYKFYYINTQNQLLIIYADSDGVISYAGCAFTW